MVNGSTHTLHTGSVSPPADTACARVPHQRAMGRGHAGAAHGCCCTPASGTRLALGNRHSLAQRWFAGNSRQCQSGQCQRPCRNRKRVCNGTTVCAPLARAHCLQPAPTVHRVVTFAHGKTRHWRVGTLLAPLHGSKRRPHRPRSQQTMSLRPRRARHLPRYNPSLCFWRDSSGSTRADVPSLAPPRASALQCQVCCPPGPVLRPPLRLRAGCPTAESAQVGTPCGCSSAGHGWAG